MGSGFTLCEAISPHYVSQFKTNKNKQPFHQTPTKQINAQSTKTMKLILISLIPVAVASWSLGPRNYNDLNPWRGPSLLDSMLDTTLLMPTPRLLMEGGMPAKTSPKYEITDTDTQIKIAMDVPGVEIGNIDVTVQDDTLTVSGHRESQDNTSSFRYKFRQSFSLPVDVNKDHIAADLKNGVLTVMAPKDPQRHQDNLRKIAITAGNGEPHRLNSMESEVDEVNNTNDEKKSVVDI